MVKFGQRVGVVLAALVVLCMSVVRFIFNFNIA